MESVLDSLQKEGISTFLESYSALDRYFGVKESGSVHLLTDSSLISLAKLFESLEYPGLPYADACVEPGRRRYIFRCVDDIEKSPSHPYTAQNLIYSQTRDAYLDPRGIYNLLSAS
jgi:hypothetical protein